MFETKEKKENLLLKKGWKHWMKSDLWSSEDCPALYTLKAAYDLQKHLDGKR